MRALCMSLLACLVSFNSFAEDKPKVIASFSIIGDMVREVAGDNVELKILVGANGDIHEYEPSPGDVKSVAAADLVFINALGLEGWIEKLITSSGSKGEVVRVSDGSEYIKNDPHAWQNLTNGKIYVKNIRDALVKIDKIHADEYQKNAEIYIKKLDELEIWVRAEISKIPLQKRTVVTTHDAFKYFSKAYGINFVSPVGISTAAQASAADMAKLLDQIRSQKITSVFLENNGNERLIKQLAKDAGVHVGGTLYPDFLSDKNGPAATYIEMFRHNVRELAGGK